MNPEQMLEISERHVRVEARREIEPLMATLSDDPVYEFATLGRVLRGRERIRRYYLQFFDGYMSRVTAALRPGQWVDGERFVLESELTVRCDGGLERHRVLSVFWSDGDRLGGERIYAGENVVRQMAGAMFDELEPEDVVGAP
jgi:hypothetical protein